MELIPFQIACFECGCQEIKPYKRYTIKSGSSRWLYYCPGCKIYFSETKHTAMEKLKTPISRITLILESLNEGQGLNAVSRVFHVSKNSIYRWQSRLSELKRTLLLFALCHQFLKQVIEGDELYTKVRENAPPELSEGWTIVLMDRASRFIWELGCGRRDRKLFKRAIRTLRCVIKKQVIFH